MMYLYYSFCLLLLFVLLTCTKESGNVVLGYSVECLLNLN